MLNIFNQLKFNQHELVDTYSHKKSEEFISPDSKFSSEMYVVVQAKFESYKVGINLWLERNMNECVNLLLTFFYQVKFHLNTFISMMMIIIIIIIIIISFFSYYVEPVYNTKS